MWSVARGLTGALDGRGDSFASAINTFGVFSVWCLFPVREGNSPRIEVPDRRVTGGSQARVSGQVSCGGELGGVADVEQDPCCGPDSDAWHRGQDLGKRVRIKDLLDLGGQFDALVEGVVQRCGQPG